MSLGLPYGLRESGGDGMGVDLPRMRAYRLGRLREQLKVHDCAAGVLFDPVNIRYATDSRNMSVWCLHTPVRYCFVPLDGPVVLFEVGGSEHLASGLECVDEVRPATSWVFFSSGARVGEHAASWAAEIADLVNSYGGGNRRLVIDRCDITGYRALSRHGITVLEGQGLLERARSVKSGDEIECMAQSLAVAELGITRMREAVTPGMTEQALWALLHQTNIEHGGEWIETRLLSSGERTNPWMQECSGRIIEDGDLVSFDTDLIGPYGYCADISRAFLAGPHTPSTTQRELYQLAREQLEHNIALLRPGIGFRDLAQNAWPIPSRFVDNRYSCVLHGVGLCDEYPNVAHWHDFAEKGYDGELEADMTVCVESYIGEAGGEEGVKLEQQVRLTGAGVELMSHYPFETDFLGREV
ncbi:Xaa-Pro peptidase family protein [Arhodomonas aquaeolei]|uniref:M24 family metallopeptidase n=1 Tax=Arhodomonas aquaeolei TaxID=2369 RepID=UPI0021696FCC|nr:Xaa-Pro peptidase family protein [Arhodomonas aquaeolei]MCS4503796.1 Xaa-Pro peptidase family protein [Arhodomonas aquaeolei]